MLRSPVLLQSQPYNTSSCSNNTTTEDEASDDGSSSSGDAGGASDVPLSSRPSSGGLTDADLQPPPGVSWKRSKSKRKLASDKDKKRKDLYALLGLQNERWTATEQQLKLGAPPPLCFALQCFCLALPACS